MRQVKKLREIANISAGQGAPQGEDSCCDYGTPFVKAGNLIELLNGKRENEVQKVNENVAKAHKLKLYPAGTVLFAKSGMSCMKGYVYQLQSPCYVVSHLACITATDVSGEYLKYYFEFHKPNSLVKDEAYPSISLADIGDMAVSYGNFDEQREIVMTLDKVRKAIELRRMELNKIDDLVKSQFIEMFGSVNKAKYPVMRIGAVAKLQGGYAFKSTDYMSNGVPIVQIANVNRDNLDWNEMNCVPAVFLEKYSEFALNPGDLVMAMTRPVIKLLNAVKIAVVSEQDVPCLLNQRVGRFRIERTKINRTYLMSCCQMQDFKDYVVAMSGNSLQPNISSKQVENYSIVLPPIELQNKFAAFVEQTDKSKFRIKQSLEKLEICYKALLQKYFG